MTKRYEQAQHILYTIQRWWHEYFLLRWTIANMLGWMLGLLAFSLLLWLAGWIGAILSGAVIGASIGLFQAWILFPPDDWSARRKWTLYSSAAIFFAFFPAVVLAFIGFFNIWIAAILIGLIVGGLLGLVQSFIFVPDLGDDAYYWIPVTIGAVIVAALLMVITLKIPVIPIIASPAVIVYALITGWQLQRWMGQDS